MKSIFTTLRLVAIIILSFLFQPLQAQNSTSFPVTGRVTSAEGEALQGVVIEVKGGSRAAATTDATGAFKINLANGNATLVISHVGYITQEIEVNNRSAITVSLANNNKELQDVVVVGYGTRRRGDVTGSIATVKADQIRQVPVTNVSQALQGRVPGLVATQTSYRPGSGSTIRIRGNRSLPVTTTGSSPSNNPLYVVDGIPLALENSIDDINPLDIESIDVLKDASATAIYGSRGANGVIQITTKKGRSGRISVEYSGSTSVESLLVPLPVFNGAEWAQEKRDGFFSSRTYNPQVSAGTATNPIRSLYFPDPKADSALFRARGDIYTWRSVAQGYTWLNEGALIAAKRPTSAAEKQLLQNLGLTILDSVAIYDPSKVDNYDWQSQAIRSGLTQNHNISLTAGSDKFHTAMSGGYYNQRGIEYGQNYSRYTISLSNDFKPTNFITVGSNVNYANSIQNLGPSVYTTASYQLPIAKPYDSTGKIIFNPGNDANIINPLNDPNTVFNEIRVNRLLANAFLEIQLYKGLKFRTTFGADLRNERQGQFAGAISSTRQGAPANASYTTRYRFNWTAQNILSYDTRFSDKHAISAVVAQEAVKNNYETNTMSAENLSYESQKWYSLQNNNTGTVTGNGSFAKYTLLSYLGRLNYTYNDRYLLTFSLRNDISSVLAPGHQSQVFPSGALAWRVDQESFMKDITFLDQLKLRAGYGSVGNASISPYQTGGTLNRTLYNWGGASATGYSPATLLRPDLTWEKTVTKNLAVDFGILKNRITGTVDVYESNTNTIQNRSLPGAGGIASALVNLGNVRNKGVEISLSTVNIDQPSGLKWTTDFVVSKNKEAITYIDGKGDNVGNQWFIGQPSSIYYDWKFMRIFQYSDTVKGGILADYFWQKAGNKSNAAYQPGVAYVADMNHDTTITAADKVILGSANPKWTGSFSSNLSWKGFDLGIFVYAQYGSLLREIRPALNARNQSIKVDYWTPTNPSNEYAQADNRADIQLYWQSMGFRSGDFIRVRSMSLAYHVPKTLINKAKLNNLTVSVNVVNPFLFAKYKTADPETVPYFSSYLNSNTSAPGPSSYSYRSFVFGVRMGL